MVIVLILRFIKPDKEEEFRQKYRVQRPTGHPAFKGEILTRVSDDAAIPAPLKSLLLGGPGCVTYLNVATWDSWEAFADAFDLDAVFDPEIETAPRQRVVLDVISDTGSG